MVLLTEQIIRGKTRLDKLDEVKNLNLWGQDLDDVSILQNLQNVEVLSLSVNRISSLKDFRHCKRLKELYLRKNYVTDINEVQYLMPLTDLKVLWLCDNPCADHPLYRQLVARLLPGVDKLDNMEITPQEKDAARRNPDLTRYLSAISASGGSPGAGPGGPGGGYADRGPGGYADRGGAAPYGNNGYGGGGGGGSPMLPEIGNAGRGGSGPLSPPQISPPPPPMQPPQQGGYGGFTSPSAAGSRPMSQQPGGMPDGMLGRAPSAGGLQDPARRRKNVLYAVMALVPELDEDDLVYVKREIEQRLGAMGR